MEPVALRGKRALVTGGARRLGRAVVQALAGAGVQVIVHYRTAAAEAERTVAEARNQAGEAWPLQADLSNPAAAEAVFDEALRLAGPIDFLVNNASIFPEDDFWRLDSEAVHRNLDINALAPCFLARALARQGRTGAVVNFLDTRIQDYDRSHLAYHLSKRVLHTLTRALALELAPGVRVNAVAPGLILPPAGAAPQYLENLKHTNPLQACGAVSGITEGVLFLLRSSFVTGQVIYIDGGRHLYGNVYD